MKWTGLNELRESYLSFFESKGHLRLDSASLVPQGDNSILLINAGMTPLKKYFKGLETPPSKRATSCQKCIRTPDIENVGFTARHGTYFEMLGNFSFGDYFKKEATAWAWEYLTKVLEIPEELLWITIYDEDDEAGDIWANEVGIPREKIVKMGKADNFWEHGSGPCGPCSEIHFDRGPEHSCGKPDCKLGCECDRYVEIWNLVFTQLDSDGKGNYTPLATKNIDTGLGLERLAVIMQGVNNLFEVDTVQNIMKKICSIINKEYKKDDKEDVSIRIMTDHIRSTTFMVADGVRPSNEGRGYVLRRLLRRAARHARLLGYDKPFLYQVCDTVIDENLSAYPELNEKREYIKKVIQTEEESFAKTIEKGLQILSDFTSNISAGGVLDGESVFKLHDTYGFPLDLTREILAEKSIGIDEEKFRELMKIQKDTARSNQAFKGGWDEAASGIFSKFTTSFVGYDKLKTDSKILAFVKGSESVDTVNEGDEILVLLDTTPFYAESGGQVGDSGIISNGDNILKVYDTKKLAGGQFICSANVISGSFFAGDNVSAEVDKGTRQATMRNHTAAHLLQAALRQVLGDHVHQAGSYVDAERCRFDFSHFSALTADEISEVERIVNEKILEGILVVTEELPIEEAQKKGAMALFGEKYGKVVRVVEIPGFSTEFCGGTHLDNTAKAGLFKIISESSVAGGVRRIEAVTGSNVLDLLSETQGTLSNASAIFKLTNSANLVNRCECIMQELSDAHKEIDALRRKISGSAMENALVTKAIGSFTVITGELPDTTGDNLKKAADDVKTDGNNYIIMLAGHENGKGNLFCKCGNDAVSSGAHAGNIVKQISALAGGKGGGKPDSAMAGITEIEKIPALFEALADLVGGI